MGEMEAKFIHIYLCPVCKQLIKYTLESKMSKEEIQKTAKIDRANIYWQLCNKHNKTIRDEIIKRENR